MSADLKAALEKLRDVDVETFYGMENCYDTGFDACLELLWPVVDAAKHLLAEKGPLLNHRELWLHTCLADLERELDEK